MALLLEVQSQIRRTLSEQNAIEIIRGFLSEDGYAYRSTFADAVCRRFGFYDARGGVQRSGCIKALRKLERAGHFILPAASARGARGSRSARRLEAPVEDPQDVPERAGEVRGLCLIKVDTLERMRIWNEREFAAGLGYATVLLAKPALGRVVDPDRGK